MNAEQKSPEQAREDRKADHARHEAERKAEHARHEAERQAESDRYEAERRRESESEDESGEDGEGD